MRIRRGRNRDVDRPEVRIVDLPERHEESYFRCLEDWSPDMAAVCDHKRCWFEQHRDQGLGVKLAVDTDDRPVGMIQYVPIEMSPADGDDLYMILCIWVHGYERGVGDVQGAGIGTRLLAAAEEDVRSRGAKGLAAWGMFVPVWMKASWFQRHGYVTADRMEMRELVWKPFSDDAQPPRWIRPQALPVDAGDHVVAFHNGWCPAANLVYERARRAADELGVPFETIDTTDRLTRLRFGRTDDVLVGGHRVQHGAPPSFRAIRRIIARHRRHHRPDDRA